jgi:hypothetical protein
MPLTEFKVVGLDQGMDRSKPAHLIPDRNYWTAENVRFDIGKTLPILGELEKYSETLDQTANGLVALGVQPPDPLTSLGTQFIAVYADNSGNKTVTFKYGDTYANSGGSVNVANSLAGAHPGGFDIYNRDIYCGVRNSAGSGGHQLLRWLNKSTVEVVLTSANNSYDNVKLFETHLFTHYVTSNISKLRWSDNTDFTDFTTGQSNEIPYNYTFGGIETVGQYLAFYLLKGIYRVNFIGLPTIFNIEEVTRDIGVYRGIAFVQNPVIEKHGVNYFVSDFDTKDIFVFNGVNMPTRIGNPIRDVIFNILDEDTTESQVLMGYNPPKREVCVWVTDDAGDADASATTNHIYMFNTHTKSWSYMDLDSAVITNTDRVLGFTGRFSPDMRVAVHKDESGTEKLYVYQFDTGTAMKIPKIVTKLYDFGRPDIFKRLLRVELVLSALADVDMDVRIDYADSPGDIKTGDTHTVNFDTEKVIKIYPDVSGRYFQLEITTDETDYTDLWELAEIRFYFKERGSH